MKFLRGKWKKKKMKIFLMYMEIWYDRNVCKIFFCFNFIIWDCFETQIQKINHGDRYRYRYPDFNEGYNIN